MNNGSGQFNSKTEWAMVGHVGNVELPPLFLMGQAEIGMGQIEPTLDWNELGRVKKVGPFSALVGGQHAGVFNLFSTQ